MAMSLSSLSLIFVLSLLTSTLILSSLAAVQDPELVVEEVHRSIDASRRKLGNPSCATGNPIDDCWRCYSKNWTEHRKRLADCAIGFGKHAVGGRDGKVYLVTDASDRDPVKPINGTLRYAVIQDEPLWITFERDMTIELKAELIMNSYKTIDGRGANVHIAGGPCITVQGVSNIIIHGIHIHNCKCTRTRKVMVRDTPRHYGWRKKCDGDGVSIFNASNIWVDHCSLSNCADGLIDAIMGSTSITISNNYFSHHDDVMLLGHNDSYTRDKKMQVTIAFNHFGEGLVQRMPRCRLGFVHVANNYYKNWEMYAIGGGANCTINSQGNVFDASNNKSTKAVTKHEEADKRKWKYCNWRSVGDLFLNGAFFTESGSRKTRSYAKASSFEKGQLKSSSLVAAATKSAGALHCRIDSHC